MRPLVRDGDILVVGSLDQSQPRLGDVVLCSTDLDNVIVHRVIRRRVNSVGYSYLVQGDQANKPDGWIPREHMLGRLTMIEREGTLIAMRNPWICLLGTFAFMRSRWNYGRSGFGKYLKRLPVISIFIS